MEKDITELPSDVQEQIQALEALPDDQIDTTYAPEILDWSDARRGVFYRPVKRQITLRLDADIIAWFKAHARNGRGYQTDINAALREHVQDGPFQLDDHPWPGLSSMYRRLRASLGCERRRRPSAGESPAGLR